MSNSIRWLARKTQLTIFEGYGDAVADKIIEAEQMEEARRRGLFDAGAELSSDVAMMASAFAYWLELPDNKSIGVRDLVERLSEAMHPNLSTDAQRIARGACIRELEIEVRRAVDRGVLKLRNPLTMGEYKFTHGAALWEGVTLPADLFPFLASRGIGLRLIPGGNGPTLWTLEKAAAALAEQEGWHAGARDTLLGQMMQAAQDGLLTVRHPHTDAPYLPRPARKYYELVEPIDVNEWLQKARVPYRWNIAGPVVTTEPQGSSEHPGATTAPTMAPVAKTYPAVKKEGFVLKKAALIKKYSALWPTIESDFNHASENGLSSAAKAIQHGDWYESAVLAWADQRGKRLEQREQEAANSVFNLPGKKHKIGI